MIKLVLMNSLLLMLSLVRLVNGSDTSATNRFLGSPLLILVALIAIDVGALAYHRLRK